MKRFDHERLDVYNVSIEFVTTSEEISGQMPKGRAYIVDQLRRAAMSIPLNIAEGAGEFSRKDKARFYRMALRSATECAAILDVCRGLGFSEAEILESSRDLLLRIVSMLTRISRKLTGSGTGTGTGTGTE